MKLVNIAGYLINPDAIAYVQSVGPRGPMTANRSSTILVYFIGRPDHLSLDMTANIFAQELKIALAEK